MPSGLSTEVRHNVYQFLATNAVLTKIAVLSKYERSLLKQSALTRVGRSWKVTITDREEQNSICAQGNSFLDYAMHIVSDIELVAILQTGPTPTAQ